MGYKAKNKNPTHTKVLRLPAKMQVIFWKRRKSLAPVTQNDFWHAIWNLLECHEVPTQRNDVMKPWKPPTRTTFAELAGAILSPQSPLMRPSVAWLGELHSRSLRSEAVASPAMGVALNSFGSPAALWPKPKGTSSSFLDSIFTFSWVNFEGWKSSWPQKKTRNHWPWHVTCEIIILPTEYCMLVPVVLPKDRDQVSQGREIQSNTNNQSILKQNAFSFDWKITNIGAHDAWNHLKRNLHAQRDAHLELNQSEVYATQTRCSPRTRMLTRMLLVQMSKHMDMQSRRTLFCNSLFEQSCTYFPCYQSAVWSGKCSVWSVEWKV